MNGSFEEKSVWIQLISLIVSLGLYFIVAGVMFYNRIHALPAFVPMFVVAVILIMLINIAGHVVVAIASRPEGRDERDRLIEWRAESNSAWVLGAGVILAIMGMIVSVDNIWIAHLLLISLFVSEVLKEINQLVYYRRGV
jgi:hypothetical protein